MLKSLIAFLFKRRNKKRNKSKKIKKRRVFKNKLYPEKLQKYPATQLEPPKKTDNLINCVGRLTFGLSSLCNYSAVHPKCPISTYKNVRVLPSKIVNSVIDRFAKLNYSGIVAFHRYNEPLIDPRFFEFVKYTKTKCPDSKIMVGTNGFYLDQTILNELDGLIWAMNVSAYSRSEYERLSKLKANFPYMVSEAVMDNRLNLYERASVDIEKPCHNPVWEISINYEGKVVLCCWDWQDKYTFGDLNKESIDEVLNSEKIRKLFYELVQGKRTLPICKKCIAGR